MSGPTPAHGGGPAHRGWSHDPPARRHDACPAHPRTLVRGVAGRGRLVLLLLAAAARADRCRRRGRAAVAPGRAAVRRSRAAVPRPPRRAGAVDPRLLGIHLGVALLALAATGAFITPRSTTSTASAATRCCSSRRASGSGWSPAGSCVRRPRWCWAWPGPHRGRGVDGTGESANLAAVAAFLVVVPPGPDAHGAAHPSRAHLRWALLWLRLGVGTALIVLAFSEKLTNPAMAIDTLATYPPSTSSRSSGSASRRRPSWRSPGRPSCSSACW